MTYYCPCNRCNGLDTGYWENEEDWMYEVLEAEKQYYRESKIMEDEQWDAFISQCREEDICPNCGSSPWDNKEEGPCSKCR